MLEHNTVCAFNRNYKVNLQELGVLVRIHLSQLYTFRLSYCSCFSHFKCDQLSWAWCLRIYWLVLFLNDTYIIMDFCNEVPLESTYIFNAKTIHNSKPTYIHNCISNNMLCNRNCLFGIYFWWGLFKWSNSNCTDLCYLITVWHPIFVQFSYNSYFYL